MALEFTINLNGNLASGLEKSAKGLDETSKKSHEAEKALELCEGELGKVNVAALGINFSAIEEGGHLFNFDLAEGARVAFEAIEKVVDVVADLTKEILKAAAGAEDLNLAIELDVGKEGLEKVNDLAESFGNTRFDDDVIKKSLLPLIEESGDEHSDQWNDLVTAATDVATRRNKGAAGVGAALDALRGIEIQPQKIRGALKELGIKQKDFYDDLGDLLGISADAAEKQVKAGKIKSQTLLSVALHQIAERQGGALGIATNEGSKTLGAALERLSNLKENVFKQAAGGPGIKELQRAIDNFVDKVSGPVGQKAIAALDHLFGAIGHFANAHADAAFDKVSAALDFVASALEGNNETWNRWVRNWNVVVDVVGLALKPFLLIRDAMLAVEGTIIEVGLTLDGFLLDVGAVINEAIHGNFSKALELGKAIVDGIVDGVVQGFWRVEGAVEDLAGGAVDAVKRKLHISSPSKVFAELGAFSVEGYAEGLESGSVRVAGSANDIAEAAAGGISKASPAIPAVAFSLPSLPGSSSAAPQFTYSPVFHVGSAAEAESLERQHVRPEFMRIVEELLIATGGKPTSAA